MTTTHASSDSSPPRRVLRGADLRGLSFDRGSLAGADFNGARTGMRPGWQLLMVAGGLVASLGLGIVTGLAARYLMGFFDSGDPRKVALALNATAALVVYTVAAVWKGGDFAVRMVLPIVAALFLSAALIAVLTGVGTGVGAIVGLAFVLLGAVIVILGALARAVAGTAGMALFAPVAIAGALAGGIVGGGVPATIIALSAMIVGRRSLGANPRHPLLARLCVELACKGGTHFRGTDLAGADFTGATLTACDFRGADLTGARLEDATISMCLFDGDRATPPTEHRTGATATSDRLIAAPRSHFRRRHPV